MAEFYERLNDAMKINGISQTELCVRTQIPKSAMSQYMSGAFKPKQDRTYLIACALNVSEAWLMGFDVPMERKNPSSPSDLSELYEKYPSIKPIKKIKIPMLGKIACGEPTFADEGHETYIETDGHIQADFCLTCAGDSMLPKIENGDIVFIRKQEIVDDGQIAAVIIGDEATLKRVYYDKPNNILQLIAENPKYKPLVYSGSELDQVHILGRAVSLYRKI